MRPLRQIVVVSGVAGHAAREPEIVVIPPQICAVPPAGVVEIEGLSGQINLILTDAVDVKPEPSLLTGDGHVIP